MSNTDDKRPLTGHPTAIYIWHETATTRHWIGADGLAFVEWHPSACVEGGW